MEQARREGFALCGAEVVEEPPPPDQNAALILEEVGEALLPYSAQLRLGRPRPEAEAAVEHAVHRLGAALTMPRSQYSRDWDLIFLTARIEVERLQAIGHALAWKISRLSRHDPERMELALTLDQVGRMGASAGTLLHLFSGSSRIIQGQLFALEGVRAGLPVPNISPWRPEMRPVIAAEILHGMAALRHWRFPQMASHRLANRLPEPLLMLLPEPKISQADAIRTELPDDRWIQARAARMLEGWLKCWDVHREGGGPICVTAAINNAMAQCGRSWRSSQAGGGSSPSVRRAFAHFCAKILLTWALPVAFEAHRWRQAKGVFPLSLDDSLLAGEPGMKVEYWSNGDDFLVKSWLRLETDSEAIVAPAIGIDKVGVHYRGEHSQFTLPAPQ
jgi:hypothetical protein